MRYGIISDIHSNLEAFHAVVTALSRERVDAYLSIGDLIGYGADPGACIRLMKSLDPVVLIAGNHEWGVLDLKELEYFNEAAQQAILWTKKALSEDERDYLKSYKLLHEDGRMTLVHGTLNSPEEFYYIIDMDDAYLTMQEMKTPVCFVGHSHVPRIFHCEDGKMKSLNEPETKIDRDKKYVINVGSVGQPRDGDPRSAYAIYDDEELTIELQRVEYDVAGAQKKILDAGLPRMLALRLSEGR